MIACSEGSQPTQPSARATERGVSAARPNADVAATDLPSTITACYVAKKGTIYRIKTPDTPAECVKGDIEFSWEAAPVRAIAGMTFYGQGVTIPEDGRYVVFCPAGYAAINFGWEIPINSTAQASQIKGVRPALSQGRVGWGIQAAAGTQYVLYWTCAPAEPGVLATP
jgi:hypothetical protein